MHAGAIEDPVHTDCALVAHARAQLGEEASDKVLEIEQQYSKLRRPMYAQRNELLKGIPSFWQIALLRHRELRNTATEDDEAVLGFCTEVGLHAGPRGAGIGSGRSSARTSWSQHRVCECLYRPRPILMQPIARLARRLGMHSACTTHTQHTLAPAPQRTRLERLVTCLERCVGLQFAAAVATAAAAPSPPTNVALPPALSHVDCPPDQMLVEDFDDIKSGFRIIFRFANDNPYFSNQEVCAGGARFGGQEELRVMRSWGWGASAGSSVTQAVCAGSTGLGAGRAAGEAGAGRGQGEWQ